MRKSRRGLREDDQWWERRWKELGYDKQEQEYYASPAGVDRLAEMSAPQSSHGLHRFIREGQSGVQLVVWTESSEGRGGGFAPYKTSRRK